MSTQKAKENKTKIIIVAVAAIAVITCIIFLIIGLPGGSAPVNAEEADNEETTTTSTTTEFNVEPIAITTSKTKDPDQLEENPEPSASGTVTLVPGEDEVNAIVEGDSADVIQSLIDEGYDVDFDIEVSEEAFETPEVTQATTPATTVDWGNVNEGDVDPSDFFAGLGEGGGEIGEVIPGIGGLIGY